MQEAAPDIEADPVIDGTRVIDVSAAAAARAAGPFSRPTSAEGAAQGQRSDLSRVFNLNLLPVLRELLNLQNVSQVAAALNMSQSAVSDALARLRNIFQDELLIPSRPGFVLSDKAEELKPFLDQSLDRISVMLGAQPFDPAQASGRIHIACSDYVALIIGPPLVRRLRALAGGLCVQFHDIDDDSVDALLAGQLDFVLHAEGALPLHRELDHQPLFEEEFVLIRGTTVQGEELERRRAATSRGRLAGGFWAAAARATIGRCEGGTEIETVVSPTFMLLPFVVENTDVAAVVQRRLGEKLAPGAAIRISAPSVPLPGMRVHALWRRARAGNALHCWLIDLMSEIGAELADQEQDA